MGEVADKREGIDGVCSDVSRRFLFSFFFEAQACFKFVETLSIYGQWSNSWRAGWRGWIQDCCVLPLYITLKSLLTADV